MTRGCASSSEDTIYDEAGGSKSSLQDYFYERRGKEGSYLREEINKSRKTLKLKAKVTATKKANTKLNWTSSNKKYATVSSSGKVKALKAGKGKKVKITAMATDGSGKKKVVTIKIQ